MKLGNHGFAISTILYGLLLLLSMVLLLLIATMSGRNTRDSDFVDQVKNQLNECTRNGTC